MKLVLLFCILREVAIAGITMWCQVHGAIADFQSARVDCKQGTATFGHNKIETMVNKMNNKELLSALLDGEISPDELGVTLASLRAGKDERDAVTVYQLINDAMSGVRVLDDGYTVRILARLEAHRNQDQSK